MCASLFLHIIRELMLVIITNTVWVENVCVCVYVSRNAHNRTAYIDRISKKTVQDFQDKKHEFIL